jgi:hypothetical protein
MNARDQHRHIGKLQKGWATDAFKDMKYNANRARIERKRGNFVLANAYDREARWDKWWGNRRMKIVRGEDKKGNISYAKKK